MEDHSIHQVPARLTNNSNCIDYDNIPHVPDRAAARAKMSGTQDATENKRCTVCVDAAVKAAFDRKVKSLIHTLLDDKKMWVPVERRDNLSGGGERLLRQPVSGLPHEDYVWKRGCRLLEPLALVRV